MYGKFHGVIVTFSPPGAPPTITNDFLPGSSATFYGGQTTREICIRCLNEPPLLGATGREFCLSVPWPTPPPNQLSFDLNLCETDGVFALGAYLLGMDNLDRLINKQKLAPLFFFVPAHAAFSAQRHARFLSVRTYTRHKPSPSLLPTCASYSHGAQCCNCSHSSV